MDGLRAGQVARRERVVTQTVSLRRRFPGRAKYAGAAN